LHAICRKNYGCTHFIVGRDHAGVGGFYHPSEACDIFQEFCPNELGIQLLFYPQIPYYCRRCNGVVTSKICPHEQPSNSITGTQLRKMLSKGKTPPKEFMRPEVSRVLLKAVGPQIQLNSRCLEILVFIYSLQYLRQKLAKRERLSTIRFLPSKAKNEKGTTAHGRYNNRFTVFKPMSR
jgi:ATP sulfurylase